MPLIKKATLEFHDLFLWTPNATNCFYQVNYIDQAGPLDGFMDAKKQ